MKDQNLVKKLTQDLSRHGQFWNFRQGLKKGLNLHKQIDEALGESDYVLCIITKNYFQSQAALDEAYAMFPEQEKLRMLYFEEIPKNIQKKHRILSAKWGIYFHNNYENGINELIQSIGGISNYVETYAETQNRNKINPFYTTRADFENPDFISRIFYEPEKEKYDRLTGPQAVIMEGGRGSGKTMILKSLEIIPAIERTGKKSFKETKLNYFGIYIRIHRGGFALSNESELELLGEKIAKYVFLDDMNLQFTEAFIDNLAECMHTNRLDITNDNEKIICKEISSILKPKDEKYAHNFKALKIQLNKEKSNIRQFIVKKAMEFNPEYNGCFSGLDTFNKICLAVKSIVSELKNVRIFLLIDEYENFLSYQQKIVNTLIKLADNTLTIKIASKFEGIYTKQTLLGQELQRNHDYYRISLDYDLRKPEKLSLYKELVVGVSHKYLENSGYANTNIIKLLKKGTDQKITDDDLKNQLDKMLSNKQRKTNYTKEEKNYLLTYYHTTLIFRSLIDKRLKKDYSGFNNYVYLSSGIIRFFLDLCGMAFLLASQKNIKVSKMKEIPPEIQSAAAHAVSHALLEKLALGAEDHGIAMQKFVLDIGDIFRTKLLYDNNEPETMFVTIEEPESRWPERLKSLLSTGVRESVFQRIEDSEGMKVKNPTAHRPTSYLLNRMYAPGLGINHTARWRTLFKANELDSILSDEDISKTKIRIISKIKKEIDKSFDDRLFNKEQTKTLDEWS